MAISKDTMNDINQLKELINQKRYLTKALVYAALIKDKTNGKYSLRYLRVQYADKNDETKEEKYDYSDIIFLIKHYELDEVFGLITTLFSKNGLRLDSYDVLPIEIGNYLMRADVESYYPYGYLMSEWPAIYLSNQIQGNTLPNNYDVIAKPSLPSFPDIDTAIVHLFGLNPNEPYSHVARQIEIIIPEYRCRIKTITIDDKNIIASIESKDFSEKDLIAKIYCRYSDKGVYYDAKDFPIQNNVVNIPINGSVIFVDFSVLSAKNSQILDYRRFSLPYWHDYNGTITIKGKSGLTAIIMDGESQTTEFKALIKDADDFLETVIAFANTNNGTIFVGVNDKSNVIGVNVDHEEFVRKIDNWIGDLCTPKPKYNIKRTKIDDKEIELVSIEEGDKNNKPYSFRGTKILVRANSSDRPIGRFELEEMYRIKYTSGIPPIM